MRDAQAVKAEPFEASAAILVSVDASGRVSYANPAFMKLPEDGEAGRRVLLTVCRRSLATGQSQRQEAGRPDHGVLLCQADVWRDDQGRTAGAALVAVDVSSVRGEFERLRRYEALYADAQNAAQIGIWEWRPASGAVTWSAGLYRIFGLSPAEHKPSYERYLESVHPEDRARVRAVIEAAVTRSAPFSHDERILWPDGTVRYLHTWGRPVTDARGKVVSLIGVCQDVTEQRAAEEATRRSYALLRAVFEASPVALFLKGPDGRFLMVNETAARLLGRPAVRFVGLTSAELFGRERAARLDAFEARVRERGETETVELDAVLLGRARRVSLTLAPWRGADGRLAGLVGVVEDVTERRQARAQLERLNAELESRAKERAEELEYRGALLAAQQETALEGILVVDDKGRIISYNARFREIWDIPESLLAAGSDDVALGYVTAKLADPGGFMERVRRLYEHRDEKSFDVVFLKDGRSLERYSSPVFGKNKRYFGRVWYFRDLSTESGKDR